MLDDLAARISAVEPKARRRLIAVAGPPGSGKTTLAEKLVTRLGSSAALVPMDGFHLDNSILDARGHRARKGAPHTFDAKGFVHAIRRLGTEDEVILPVFDRTRDLAIAGALPVGPETRTAVIEGNYLLLNDAPWSDLHALWDLSIFLDVSEGELARRLIQRWIDHDHSPEDAKTRAMSNDMPNADRVRSESVRADLTI